jgi:aspartyl/glutamyl-tRNA(Asn/Gln) amidotransferase C subunit
MTHVSVDVKALSELARLQVSAEELARFEKQLPDILEFVRAIEAVSTDSVSETPVLKNVMRPDSDPHESGIHTAELLAAAPQAKNDKIVVKQVISRKKN